MNRFKLVVADVDGTLLTTGQPLPAENAAAIEKLKERGILFGVASGRNVYDVSRLPQRWGLSGDFDIIIGMNGSELYDGIEQKQYDYYKLSSDVIREIVTMMRPFDLNPFIYYKDGMKVTKLDEGSRASSVRNHMPRYLAQDDSELWETENAKVLYRTPEDRVAEVKAFVAQHPSEHYKLVQTQKTMLEFVDPRTRKSYALEQFCLKHGIALDEVVSFGDASNDNDLLAVSYGVCLLNGSDDTKAVAKEITEKNCDEAGFADWLEKNVFNR